MGTISEMDDFNASFHGLSNMSIIIDMNSTDGNDSFEQPNSTTLVVPIYIGAYVAILNCFIFLTGIIANVIIIVVVISQRDMRRTINFYLANLSVADLFILLVCQPVATSDYFNRDRWYFGPILCKLVPIVEHVVLHTSLLTILVIYFERRNAICHPLSILKRSGSVQVKIIIPLIWLISIVISLPFIGMAEMEEVNFLDGTQGPACFSTIDLMWKKIFVVANFLLLFFLPVNIMTFLLFKTVQTLRSSDNFRGLLQSNIRKSSRCSLSSIISPLMDDGMQNGLRQKKKLESVVSDREIITNIIEEESEEITSQLPDVVIQGKSSFLTESDDNYSDTSTPLIRSCSSTPDLPIRQLKTEHDTSPKFESTSFVESLRSARAEVTSGPSQGTYRRSPRQLPARLNSLDFPKPRFQHRRTIGKAHSFSHGSPSKPEISAPKARPERNSISNIPLTRDSISRRFSLSRNDDTDKRLSAVSSGGFSHQSTRSCSTFTSTVTHKSKIKFLIAIFIYFVISHLPIRIFILLQVFAPSDIFASLGIESYINLCWGLRLVMFLHSAANPFFYCFMSSKFSKAVKRLFSVKRKEKSIILSLPLTQLNMTWEMTMRNSISSLRTFQQDERRVS